MLCLLGRTGSTELLVSVAESTTPLVYRDKRVALVSAMARFSLPSVGALLSAVIDSDDHTKTSLRRGRAKIFRMAASCVGELSIVL